MMIIFRSKQWSIHITCLFIYCFTIAVPAQDQNTTSTTTILDFEKSLQGKSFDEVTDIFYKNFGADSLKSSLTIKYIKNNFLALDNKENVINSYYNIATWNGKIRKRAEAIIMVDKGLAIAKEIDDTKLIYNGYQRKAGILYYAGKNIEALDELVKAYNIVKKENDIRRQLMVSNNIGLIRIQVEDDLGAIDLYLENLKIIEAAQDGDYKTSKLQTYLGLCKAYINISEYDKAEEYCSKGVLLGEELDNLEYKSNCLAGLGDIAASKGDFEQAYAYFDQVNTITKELDIEESFDTFMQFYQGKTKFLEGKYEEAVVILSKVAEIIEKNKLDYLSIQGVYYYLAKSYKELGDSQQSLKFYDIAEKLDQENDKKRQKINAKITKKFNLPKLKEEIEVLIAKAKQTKYIYYSGIGLLLFVIVGLILFNRKQQKKNKNRFSALMQQLEEKRQKEKSQHKTEASSLQAKTSKNRAVVKGDLGKKQAIQIDTKDAEILKKLVEFEQKELFLNQDSTLVEVAKKIRTNTTYLSKVINTHKQKSFTAYITDLRVDYSIERLSHDRKFRSFTIGAIAQEIGFKRSESFSKAFKVKTGLYPSYFIKELEKQ